MLWFADLHIRCCIRRKVTQEWLEPFADFIVGREIKWGTKDEDEVRTDDIC
jgi:hypothetical protein